MLVANSDGQTSVSSPVTSPTYNGESKNIPEPGNNENFTRRPKRFDGNATFRRSFARTNIKIVPTIKWHNGRLNDRQKSAVTRVLSGNCRPMPYVIFGPQGTGKTATVVECILQVFGTIKSSRILACTPSNSAADLMMERLVASNLFTEADLVRLNAFHRSDEIVPDSIKPFCRNMKDLATNSRYRVIVCTCMTAGNFHNLRLRADHFSHLFLDEAGQATEPLPMISITLVANFDGQIVLAGDPEQLGPVVQSVHSAEYGLRTSFLERIMALLLCQRNSEMYKGEGNHNTLLVRTSKDSLIRRQAQLGLFNSIQNGLTLLLPVPKRY